MGFFLSFLKKNDADTPTRRQKIHELLVVGADVQTCRHADTEISVHLLLKKKQ